MVLHTGTIIDGDALVLRTGTIIDGDALVLRTGTIIDGDALVLRTGTIIDGDALDEYYKFRTRGNILFFFLNSLVSILNSSHNLKNLYY